MSEKKNSPSTSAETPDFNNPDFQAGLKALLDVYRPMLEHDLNLTKNPAELQKQVAATLNRTCAQEFEEAHAMFSKFLNDENALRLLPPQALELLGPREQWRWCLQHIICCLVFGWLVCRWPRTFRGYAYYLYEFWRCVRQVIGTPVHEPPTEIERRDFEVLVKVLAEAFKPYLTDQLATVEYPAGVPEDIFSGKIDCLVDERQGCVLFERLLTSEAARALLGEAAFKEHSQQRFFWFCRCWCLCALCLGCCLARARNVRQIALCLHEYYDCLRNCFRPLTCDLTGPSDCVPEVGNVPLHKIGAAIEGTAAGAGFDHYILEWSQDFATWHATNFNYPPIPPGGGSQGNIPVVSGELAFLDTSSMNEGTTWIRMTVFGAGTTKPCGPIDFQIFRQNVWISGVDDDFNLNTNAFDPNAMFVETVPALCSRISEVAEVSFGGSITVQGSAFVGGCADKQIRSYSVDYQAGFTTDPTLGVWTNILSVIYNPADPYQFLIMNERRDNSDLLAYWGSYTICLPPPFGCILLDPQGELYPTNWSTQVSPPCGLSGLYTLRLMVQDASGNLYYDTQRIWFDNKPICAMICVPSVPRCADLFVSQFAQPPDCSNPWCLPLMGIAYDEPIDTLKPLTRPNLNFDYYIMHVEKQGGPEISIPIVNNLAQPCVIPGPPFNPCYWGTSPVGDPGTRCTPPTPTCPDPSNPLNPAVLGLLTQFDLRAVDPICSQQPNFPYPVPKSFTIDRGTCCVYNFKLWVYDRTIVNGGGPHGAFADYPIKICNDLK